MSKNEASIPTIVMPTLATGGRNLEDWLTKTVDDICPDYGAVNDTLNHCAHFVSHVLDLRYPGAALCSNVAGSTTAYANRRTGVCIRVNDIFNRQSGRAYYDTKTTTGRYLIYATIPANISAGPPIVMSSMSRKHIGFFVDGFVYHYSNGQDKVVKQEVVAFSRHYGSTTVLLISDMPGG